jgi:predicted ATPase
VRAALDRARGLGALALTGHCLAEGAGGYPFAPFVEIFRTLITGSDTAKLPALLGPARGAFSQLLPELAGRIGVAAPALPAAGPLTQVHLFGLILGTVERLTREHLLVVALEDLQWADESSRDLLGFLVRTVRDGRVLLVATMRPDELVRGQALLTFLAEFERSERVARIDLGRLDRSQIRELLAAIRSTPDNFWRSNSRAAARSSPAGCETFSWLDSELSRSPRSDSFASRRSAARSWTSGCSPPSPRPDHQISRLRYARRSNRASSS